jgi:hypothetical protein
VDAVKHVHIGLEVRALKLHLQTSHSVYKQNTDGFVFHKPVTVAQQEKEKKLKPEDFTR